MTTTLEQRAHRRRHLIRKLANVIVGDHAPEPRLVREVGEAAAYRYGMTLHNMELRPGAVARGAILTDGTEQYYRARGPLPAMSGWNFAPSRRPEAFGPSTAERWPCPAAEPVERIDYVDRCMCGDDSDVKDCKGRACQVSGRCCWQ